MSITTDTTGPGAPPRANGELVFAAPWEGRAFGMAVALAESGRITWDEFRERLIARISVDPARAYYACWLAVLEEVLVGAGRIGDGEVGTRATRLAGRAAGHDHAPPHPSAERAG
ncbi:nitrile hydratase accessory protein [Pseudonocardia ammonioxydans]|uniref:Nitrile hydratase accessory protein n=1 Tax=Pseudonocardia ammonioxydans TaxID=260086 RepID=A0A1I5BHG0_PSUAM|nr:nitrile hydratase accessory protein [Pseudonocardia ammonioxydans]SFN74019.1 nitrile hydratase accessory protein [Pseudonocardia ammonioxydans]